MHAALQKNFAVHCTMKKCFFISISALKLEQQQPSLGLLQQLLFLCAAPMHKRAGDLSAGEKQAKRMPFHFMNEAQLDRT